MANEEYLTILRQGVEVWHKWRKENPDIIIVDLSEADLSGLNLREVDFGFTNLTGVNLKGANLQRGEFSWATAEKINLEEADLTEATFINSIFNKANLQRAILANAQLAGIHLNGANLSGANLLQATLYDAKLEEANLTDACLVRSQLQNAHLDKAIITGTCIDEGSINSETSFNEVKCDYIYLKWKYCSAYRKHFPTERCPLSGSFSAGEFTKLFQKTLEVIKLIFRKGINWDAFAYSFKKVEVENQGAQLDVQSIEKKGDGVLVVRVAVSPDVDKGKIHYEFMQGYELAHKALSAQYQARIDDKDKEINRLFHIVNQLSETPKKVSNYYLNHSLLAGGIVDAEKVQSNQIGGDICNSDKRA